MEHVKYDPMLTGVFQAEISPKSQNQLFHRTG